MLLQVRAPIKLGRTVSKLSAFTNNSSTSKSKSKSKLSKLLVRANEIKINPEKVNADHVFNRITQAAKYVANKSTSIADYFIKSSSLVKIPNVEKEVYNFVSRSQFNSNTTKSSTSGKCKVESCGEEPGRHNYHKETEKAVNKQILSEFNTCFAYLSMACYFARSDIALPGCQSFFMRMHEEEHGHALKLINLQLLKGAPVRLYPISVPECQDWESIEKALAVSLDMEKLVKENLIKLHLVAEKHNDFHITDIIDSHFLGEQDRSICEIARLLKRVQNMGCSGITEFLFDKEMHSIFAKGPIKKGIDISPCNADNYL